MRLSRSSRLFLLTVAATAALVAGAPAGQGADPFIAGGRSTRSVVVGPTQVARALARGEKVARALALPGVTRRVVRLDDRFEHRVYDEVISHDAQGREVSIVRFEPDGRIVMALVLGWRPPAVRAVTASVAGRRGAAFARSAGLDVAGTPIVRASAGAGGWTVSWPRVVDGVPVPGDGVRVLVWKDGSFHGLTRTERPRAATPTNQIDAAAARATAESLAAARFGSAGAGSLHVVAVERAWVAPNDTWAPERPDAPEPTLRLAWIVRFRAQGALAERLRLVEFWIDAGDRRLLGGDLAE